MSFDPMELRGLDIQLHLNVASTVQTVSRAFMQLG